MNGEFRKRVLAPLMIPLTAAVFIGALVFSFSRILLAVPEAGSTVLGMLISAEILGLAAVMAAGSRVKPAQRALFLAIGLGIIAGGTATATTVGIRHVEKHGEEVAIAAKGIEFDTPQLVLPPDEKIALKFSNNDSGIPHNVAIYTDEKASEKIFVGETFSGVATKTYEVDPIPEGDYFFRCDVHPTEMTGSVAVGEGVGGPGTPALGPVPTKTAPVVPSVTASPSVVPAPPGATEVNVVDIAFRPAQVTIEAGDAVTWLWEGSIQHSVTADDGSFDSGLQTQGFSFEHTFTTPGRFEFYCKVHSTPTGSAQNGVVVVE